MSILFFYLKNPLPKENAAKIYRKTAEGLQKQKIYLWLIKSVNILQRKILYLDMVFVYRDYIFLNTIE